MEFDSSFFWANRQNLYKKVKSDLLVLTANGLMQSDNYGAYPFRQESNFWYLTGINEPDVVFVRYKTEEFLIIPKRDARWKVFEGEIDTKKLSKVSGVTNILSAADGWAELKELVSHSATFASLKPLPAYHKDYSFYTNPAAARLLKKAKSFNKKVALEDIRREIALMRMVKQPPELEAVKQAIKISQEVFNAIFSHRRSFKYEYQIEAALEAGFRRLGAHSTAFSTIVANGRNACTLHYSANNQKLLSSNLVLIDAGARYANYTADITRTISLQKPSPRQQLVHEAVLAIQTFATSQLKASLPLKDYAIKVNDFVVSELTKLGLKASPAEDLSHKYLPHGISHFLGIDVHDPADYTKPLRPGMVLTVEPGIYIPEEAIGVRIEDDVLITADGCEVLSGALSHKLW